MKRSILIIKLIVISAFVYSQTSPNQNDIVIKPGFKFPLTKNDFSYGRDSSLIIKSFTDAGKIVMTGKLKTKDPMVKNGRFTYFDTETRPLALGNYSNNLPIGVWQYFDAEGNVIKQLDYSKVIKYISAQSKIKNFDTVAYAMPVFKSDKYHDFDSYLRRNIQFPINAIKDKVNEKINFTFVVNTEGNVVNPQVIAGKNLDLNIEVIRVLSNSPQWTPGYNKQGEPVNIRFSSKVSFISYIEELITKADSNAKLIEKGYHYRFKKVKHNQYIYKQYYPSTNQILEYVTYKEPNLNTKHGQAFYWLDNGLLYEEGMYINNSKSGEWKYYDYDTGKLSEYGKYKSNNKTGLWVYLDTLGNIEAEYRFYYGKRHGKYKLYNKFGEIIETGAYSEGKLKTRKIIIEDSCNSSPNDELPYLKMCENKIICERIKCTYLEIHKCLVAEIVYPTIAQEKGIQGVAIIGFIVNKEGEVCDFKVYRGLCDEIKESCYDLINYFPDWNPAMHNGKPTDVFFSVPINFHLP